MGKAIPSQHPAVVLRSSYTLVRTLLAVAMIAVVGLTVAVVILANDGDEISSTSSARPTDSISYSLSPTQALNEARPGTRYDGGPEEGTSGVHGSSPGSSTTPGIRYDGGPEEGSARAR